MVDAQLEGDDSEIAESARTSLSAADIERRQNRSYILVMGSEHDGVGNDVRKACQKKLMIRQKVDCDSLNVGIAASVILHHLTMM